MTIPNRAFTATASGSFTDIKGNTDPRVIASWYISETAGSTGGGQILDGYVAAPAAPTTALVATGTGALSNGAYLYKVTFVTYTGETEPSPATTSRTSDSSHRQINLSVIPTGPTGRVTQRKIYRTQAAGSTYTLLATLNDNTTTTYSDIVADATISGTAAVTSANATGFVIAQFDLASKGAESSGAGAGGFESTYPGVPLRWNLTSGAVRATLFGR